MLTLHINKYVIKTPHHLSIYETLAVCSICGGCEGALLDCCPGVRLSYEQHTWNYNGYIIRDRNRYKKN